MPEKLEKELRSRAIKKRMNKKKANAYVYGTMRKTGWVPSHQQGLGNNGNNNS